MRVIWFIYFTISYCITFGQVDSDTVINEINCSNSILLPIDGEYYQKIIHLFETLPDSCLRNPEYVRAAGEAYFVLGNDQKVKEIIKTHNSGHMGDVFLGGVYLAYIMLYEYKKQPFKRYLARRRIRKKFPGGKGFCTGREKHVRYDLLIERFKLKSDSAGISFVREKEKAYHNL